MKEQVSDNYKKDTYRKSIFEENRHVSRFQDYYPTVKSEQEYKTNIKSSLQL